MICEVVLMPVLLITCTVINNQAPSYLKDAIVPYHSLYQNAVLI